MRDLLIVVGIASIGYGAYLVYQKKRGTSVATATGKTLGKNGTCAGNGITTGPTIASSAGPVDNNRSPVEHYNAGYTAKFPPVTYIQIPGAGSLDEMDASNAHAVVSF